MNNKIRRRIVNIVGIVLILLSFVFIVQRVLTMDIPWEQLLSVQIVSLIILMPLQNVLLIFIGSFCWKSILSLFTSSDIYIGDAFSAHAKSNVMKYLPGNVMQFLARQMYAESLGVTQFHMAVGTIIDLSFSALVPLMLSVTLAASTVAGLLSNTFSDGQFVVILVALIVAIMVVFVLILHFRKNKYIVELLRLIQSLLFWKRYGAVFAYSLLGTFLQGLVFVLLMSQFTFISLDKLTFVVAGCAASYFIGFVTPGVPGGIGVREAAMLFILSPFFSAESILLSAVVQRIIFIAGDVLAVPVSKLLETKHKK